MGKSVYCSILFVRFLLGQYLPILQPCDNVQTHYCNLIRIFFVSTPGLLLVPLRGLTVWGVFQVVFVMNKNILLG